jgi:hypothetical protein
VRNFLDRSALIGLTERQRQLLDYRSYYELSQYETVVVQGNEIPALPWDQEVAPNGRRVPAAYRKPSVQLGTSASIVDRIVDLSVGLDRFPVISTEGGDDTVREVLLSDDELDLEGEAPDQLVDLVAIGSVVFGFHRPEELGGSLEPVRLDSEWCEPVFVGARHSPRALELAAEYAEDPDLEGAAVLVADGPGGAVAFVAPDGARSHDVVFVRYQWPIAQEASDQRTEHAREDKVIWHRRDYTTIAIVEYAPVAVSPGEDVPIDRFRVLPVEPHAWGVVPLVWLRARGASDGEPDGRSIYSPAVTSTTESADRSASFASQAAHVSGSPVLIEQDVEDREEDVKNAYPANDEDPAIVGVGPKAVRRYRSEFEQKGEVDYLEMDGAGVEALETNARNLSQAARRAARVPELDPELLKGVLSGVALERLNEPAVARAGSYRALLQKGWKLLARKVAIVLEVESPELSFRWPKVFPPTAQDVLDWGSALVPVVAARLYPRRRVVAKLAELLDDSGDPDEILAEVDEERGGTGPPITTEPPE